MAGGVDLGEFLRNLTGCDGPAAIRNSNTIRGWRRNADLLSWSRRAATPRLNPLRS